MLDLEQPATQDSAAAPAAPADTGEFFDTSDVSTDVELDGSAEQQAIDDEIEDELEGIKLRGKKDALEKFKSERLMQADYTRKTQEVADQRKAIEAERALFQQTAQAHQAHIQEVARMVAIDERLAEFAKVDYAALADSDPVQALKLHTAYTQLQAQRGQLAQSLTQKQQAQQEEMQRARAKQIFESRQVLEREIKGWSPELAAKLTDFAEQEGFPREVLQNVTQPAFVKLAHKAFLYDQLVKQRTAKQPTDPVKPPVTRVSGGSASTTKRLSEMSDAEFAASRRNYIKNHR